MEFTDLYSCLLLQEQKLMYFYSRVKACMGKYLGVAEMLTVNTKVNLTVTKPCPQIHSLC